ncbi:hypothetical protein ACQKP8_09145 [Photobacterium alginatilyticum]|uniref:hypothetical protein n=1 Tax=Photobacterium alginatilyticum TaxID=1775171 RepID=UPI004068C01E
MTSMRIDSSQTSALTKSGQIEPKKVPENETNTKIPQSVNTNKSIQGQISQLSQVLMQMNVLQRFFTTFVAQSSSPSTPSSPAVTNLLSQLLMPENKATLIQWLRQGAGKPVLLQLLEQSRQADSPLRQWLQQLPTDKQDEFNALLKLAVEQRLAANGKDNDATLLQLHLLQPNGRELKLSVEKDPDANPARSTEQSSKWTIRLALPVGQYDIVHAIAVWQQQNLALAFESDNREWLKRTEVLSPVLTERLAILGIDSEPATFTFRPPQIVEPKTEGLSILV